MTQQQENRKLSEEELFFFEDQICAEADAVFRFCVALTLNQDQALKMLRLGFRKATAEIRTLLTLSGSELRAALFAYAYDEAQKASPPTSQGDSPLFRYLKTLTVEHRAIIASRDVCGLSVKQIAQLVSMNEDDVVKACAQARSELRQHMTQAN